MKNSGDQQLVVIKSLRKNHAVGLTKESALLGHRVTMITAVHFLHVVNGVMVLIYAGKGWV